MRKRVATVGVVVLLCAGSALAENAPLGKPAAVSALKLARTDETLAESALRKHDVAKAKAAIDEAVVDLDHARVALRLTEGESNALDEIRFARAADTGALYELGIGQTNVTDKLVLADESKVKAITLLEAATGESTGSGEVANNGTNLVQATVTFSAPFSTFSIVVLGGYKLYPRAGGSGGLTGQHHWQCTPKGQRMTCMQDGYDKTPAKAGTKVTVLLGIDKYVQAGDGSNFVLYGVNSKGASFGPFPLGGP